MRNTYTTVDARSNFATLVNEAFYGDKISVITRREQPLGFVISSLSYCDMLEKLGDIKELRKFKKENNCDY